MARAIVLRVLICRFVPQAIPTTVDVEKVTSAVHSPHQTLICDPLPGSFSRGFQGIAAGRPTAAHEEEGRIMPSHLCGSGLPALTVIILDDPRDVQPSGRLFTPQ